MDSFQQFALKDDRMKSMQERHLYIKVFFSYWAKLQIK